MASAICGNCKNQFATCACLCTFPMPLTCDGCFGKHSSKGSSAHQKISIEESMKITSQSDFTQFRMRIVNIEGAEGILRMNTQKFTDCREQIEAVFADIIYEIETLKKKHLDVLNSIESSITNTIEVAVSIAKIHAADKLWNESFGNELAKNVWGYIATGEATPQFNLFDFTVETPPRSLEKVVQVNLFHRSGQAKLSETKPNLSLIVDQFLHRFDVNKQKWQMIGLTGEILSSWKFAWDSACADFDDNIHILCTGGGSPLTNATYAISTMDGSVTELSPMRASRSGHGLSQLNGDFFAFGGYGSKRTAERRVAASKQWESLGNMNGTHQWFTSCVYSGFIYLCGGDSPVLEYLDPSTNQFTLVSDTFFTDALAESSLSVGIFGDDIIIISSSQIKKYNITSGSFILKQLTRPLPSAWSSMTPITMRADKLYLPSQDSKHVKCVDLNKGSFIEFKCQKIESV